MNCYYAKIVGDPQGTYGPSLGLSEGGTVWLADLRAALDATPELVDALGGLPVLVVASQRPDAPRDLRQLAAPLLGRGGILGSKVVLGRVASRAELVFDLAGLSAQHLAFERARERWWVTDLSMNGTMLDGRPLETGVRVPLERGGLLGLSDELWLEVWRLRDLERPGGPATPFPARGAAHPFVGRASDLLDFLELLDLNPRDGVLVLSGPDCAGRVTIRDRHVVAAEAGDAKDVVAARSLLRAKEGSFAFRPVQVAAEECRFPLWGLVQEVAHDRERAVKRADLFARFRKKR